MTSEYVDGPRSASRTGPKNAAPWRKLVAFAMVSIMVVSAFALIAPRASNKAAAPVEQPAQTEHSGTLRSISYEVSNIGWSWIKPSDYSKLGRCDHTVPGINQWYDMRINYSDTRIHDSYPYVIAYNGYSDNLVNQASYKYLTADWTTHMFYQLKVDAENITELSTGVGGDPWIVPIMLPGGTSQDGGWVNMSLYVNYLKDQEYTDIKAGTHYANTFYGVDAANFTAYWKGQTNDGWLAEIQGHWDFSRRAAHKFLGLPGTGDLVTEYNAVGSANIAWKWRAEWFADGDVGCLLDIYAAYDFHMITGNSPGSIIYVKLDTLNSTQDKIALWFYSVSWGAEYLLMRYLEEVGIEHNFQPSREDWYLNGTFGPVNGDIHERMTTDYHATAWKDPDAYNNPTWMIEPQHSDYTADAPGDIYASKFDPYYWTYYGASWRPTRMCYAPGVSAYGKGVHYWQSPMDWNLSADQSLVIKLPSSTRLGHRAVLEHELQQSSRCRDGDTVERRKRRVRAGSRVSGDAVQHDLL
jgi:hypothetical protein